MASVPPPTYAYAHPGPPPERPELPEGVRPAPQQPGWAPWTSFVALLAGLAGAVFGAIVIGAIAAAFGSNVSDEPPAVQIGATVVQDAALVFSAILFANIVRRPRPSDFGLRAVRLRRAVGWLAVAWVSFFAFSAIWAAALQLHEKDDLPSEL